LGVEQALPDAEFVLVDCDDYYQIDTSALETQLELHRDDWDECLLVPVHLYGHSADMIKIMSLAQRHDCKVLEDASQSHGTLCENGKLTGAIGHVAAFSLYPGKNLGALGDAGIVTTNDDEIAKNVSLLRNYGSERKYYYEFKGHNNRLDSMQAIFLKEKLKHLTDWNEARNNVARFYGENIENEKVIKPELASYCKYHVYHIYPVRVGHRDLFMKHLQQNDIQCGIHYPIPIELTKPFSSYGKIYNNEKTRAFAEEIVSLPIHPFMSNEDISRVCEAINRWK
jgi:dTDP-4-amino-4,6-dideoxygalactose transaminase